MVPAEVDRRAGARAGRDWAGRVCGWAGAAWPGHSPGAISAAGRALRDWYAQHIAAALRFRRAGGGWAGVRLVAMARSVPGLASAATTADCDLRARFHHPTHRLRLGHRPVVWPDAATALHGEQLIALGKRSLPPSTTLRAWPRQARDERQHGTSRS